MPASGEHRPVTAIPGSTVRRSQLLVRASHRHAASLPPELVPAIRRSGQYGRDTGPVLAYRASNVPANRELDRTFTTISHLTRMQIGSAKGPKQPFLTVRVQFPGTVVLARGNSGIEARVKVCHTPAQFSSDARKLARDGRYIVNTMHRQPRAGCARVLTLGMRSLVRPPRPEIVATYQHAQGVDAPGRRDLGTTGGEKPRCRRPSSS
jgi:hypothetical protein